MNSTAREAVKAFWLISSALFAAVLPAHAAVPGDQVIVVYNSHLPESKAVADYYAARRQVPAGNVFGFAISTNEEISRAEFRDSLQKPLAKEIESRKLWRIASHIIPATTNQPRRVEWRPAESKIRYAALCYGIPLRIRRDPNLNEPEVENLRPEMRRNEAAVDSELALLPLIEDKLLLAGPLRNPVYGLTNASLLHPTNGILVVTRLDGPSADIARGLVDKALEAERDGLWGRAYFDLRNTAEPGYKAGDEMIRAASEIARHLGFETVVDHNSGTFPASFPMSQIALYAGWYDENVSGPFTLPKVEFMPGAFAYHLHSYSAASLRTTNRFWVGPLLAKGAAMTMGSVDEPYLSGTPDIAVFLSRLIMHGFSFGEAAIACQNSLSWQTTSVGDPLYRPFARNPDELQKDLLERKSKLAEWSFLRLVNLNQANGLPLQNCTAILEQAPLTRESAVLTEKLGDLYEALGKPSSGAHAYEQALDLDPSPQQRVRLLLGLGERLVSLGREAEAYERLSQLLQISPDYPDKLGVYRKLAGLARKLGKTSDAERFETEINRLSPPAKAPGAAK